MLVEGERGAEVAVADAAQVRSREDFMRQVVRRRRGEASAVRGHAGDGADSVIDVVVRGGGRVRLRHLAREVPVAVAVGGFAGEGAVVVVVVVAVVVVVSVVAVEVG